MTVDRQIWTQSLVASKQLKADKIADSNLPVTSVRIHAIELFFIVCSVLLNKGKLKKLFELVCVCLQRRRRDKFPACLLRALPVWREF